MSHLAKEHRGGWSYLIPSRSFLRKRLAEKLARWIRRPQLGRNGPRFRPRHEGIYPDGWFAPSSWIDLRIPEPRDLMLTGTSPIDNEVVVRVLDRDLCRVEAKAGEPFRLAWSLDVGRHCIHIESSRSHHASNDRETAFLL